MDKLNQKDSRKFFELAKKRNDIEQIKKISKQNNSIRIECIEFLHSKDIDKPVEKALNWEPDETAINDVNWSTITDDLRNTLLVLRSFSDKSRLNYIERFVNEENSKQEIKDFTALVLFSLLFDPHDQTISVSGDTIDRIVEIIQTMKPQYRKLLSLILPFTGITDNKNLKLDFERHRKFIELVCIQSRKPDLFSNLKFNLYHALAEEDFESRTLEIIQRSCGMQTHSPQQVCGIGHC